MLPGRVHLHERPKRRSRDLPDRADVARPRPAAPSRGPPATPSDPTGSPPRSLTLATTPDGGPPTEKPPSSATAQPRHLLGDTNPHPNPAAASRVTLLVQVKNPTAARPRGAAPVGAGPRASRHRGQPPTPGVSSSARAPGHRRARKPSGPPRGKRRPPPSGLAPLGASRFPGRFPRSLHHRASERTLGQITVCDLTDASAQAAGQAFRQGGV